VHTSSLHKALRALGIQPTEQPWTVKLTGGPDGDVAGNMLKILDREYGSMVRVVGMADGSGCAEDPQGLPMAELLRLFELGLPLCDLRAEQLGPQGAFHSAEHADGAAKRNSMHNRVQADVFVTGGGRPSTINGSNWRDFLLPDGTPSARTIVEGANLFVTHEARQALFEHCALPIVKDSSANKCARRPLLEPPPARAVPPPLPSLAPQPSSASLTMLHPLGLPRPPLASLTTLPPPTPLKVRRHLLEHGDRRRHAPRRQGVHSTQARVRTWRARYSA
jgi:hypothetical protein